MKDILYVIAVTILLALCFQALRHASEHTPDIDTDPGCTSRYNC
jgi:hypothetical protein